MIDKFDLKQMLKEMFESGEIKIEVQRNETYVVIDGDWIRVDVHD